MSGSRNNPFDGFEFAAAPARGARPVEQIAINRVPIGASVPLGGDRTLDVLEPPLRMLAASWVYEKMTRTLFASDVFGYTVDSPEVSVEEGYRNLAARYWWFPGARTEFLIDDLEAVFETHDIEVIAPSHGVIFAGRDEVARQRTLIREILEYAATESAHMGVRARSGT